MTRIYVQNVKSQSTGTVDFKDVISANNEPQWLDKYGVIKTNKDSIDENVTIPLGTNALTAGTVRVGAGCSVTIQGVWTII